MSKNNYILHVGYTLTDPDLKTKLEPHIGKKVDDLRWELYTAVMFHRSAQQLEMKSWYDKRSRKENPKVIGYLKQLYISKKYVVAEIVVDSRWEYITLVSTTKIPPIDIKRLTSSGELGKPIVLDPHVQLEFTPYCEMQ